MRTVPSLPWLMRLVAVAAALAGSACWATSADAYVYWANFSATTPISRVEQDGSSALFKLVPRVSWAQGLAVDAQHIYWVNSSNGTIGRANLDGSEVDAGFIAGGSSMRSVASDGRHIYWANSGNGTIGRANADGSGVSQSFVSGISGLQSVAVGPDHIYWSSAGAIGRANLDGSGVNAGFIGQGAMGLAVSADYIYWSAGGPIGRANIDGTGVTPGFVSGVGASSLAVDRRYIYFTSGGIGIGRADIDGSNADPAFLGSLFATAIAADQGPAGAASADATGLAFGTQALGVLGGARSVTVANRGAGRLRVTGATVGGPNADDFLLSSDGCSGRTLAPGASCAVNVRFGASAGGTRTAALTIATDAPGAPLQIALSGSGGDLPQGPPGPAGTPGKPVVRTIELTCTNGRCTQSPVTAKRSLTPATATLKRGLTVYAQGVVLADGKRIRVLLGVQRTARAGSYRLTIQRHGRRTTRTIRLRG
jgi:hypothetical protein